ncbi:MAG: outer membrane protein assembly factor, partial [Planctomycetota bacterium]
LDTTGTLSFVEPRFLDTNFSFNSSVFLQNDEFDNFERDRVGGNLGFGRWLAEKVFGRVIYQYEENDVFNVSSTANRFVREQRGKTTTSSISPSILRDGRDNRIRPTQGGLTQLNSRIAGSILGGDNDFYSVSGEHRQYVPFFKKRIIFMGRGRIAWADGFGNDDLPVFERFFLGGARTVRGFDFREVGPKDSNGDPIGGNAALLFNAELQFPFIAGLRAVAFFDSGQVYRKNKDTVFDVTDLRTSAGGGLRILSPLGLISLDWGVKLARRPGESTSEFHFTIGRTF